MRRYRWPGIAGGLAVLILTGSLSASALARSSAAPVNNANPTMQPGGQTYVGDSISVSNGVWGNNPTKFTYRWARCDAEGDRRNCVAITGATSQSYTVTKADVNHKLNAEVTASNADGSATADASTAAAILDSVAPVNTARPTISGTAAVGNTLTANNGTWRGAVSFRYQWQQCDQNGNNCAAISGANGKTYGVSTANVSRGIRVVVTATNKFGSRAATSDRTPLVPTPTPQSTTTVVTTTVQANKAPSIAFISLKRIGGRIYARFRTCDDSGARIKVIERDVRAATIGYQRGYSVFCGTHARNWKLLNRFKKPGRLVVTLRARDNTGRMSRMVSRSVRIS
jgi:hypothetical protein